MKRWLLLCLLVGCKEPQPWNERELKPTDVELGGTVKVKVSVPDGVTRTNAGQDPSARFESSTEGGPTISVYIDQNLSQALVTNPPIGATAFERRDLPGGQGFTYLKDGPHVHTTRKVGANTIACDGFFLGHTKDELKREDMLWKVCTSIE
jgi:hypothetical protein